MLILYSLLAGLLAGSFATVCISRLPYDQSVCSPRSQCPSCHSLIRWYHNIPVISFLFLRGRCRACHRPISWEYPAIELSMAAGMGAIALLPPHRLEQDLLTQLAWFYSLTISIIDFRHRIIPDELSLSMGGIAVLLAPLNPMLNLEGSWRWMEAAATGLGGGLFMLGVAWIGEKAFKKEALGGGDIKWVASMGALLGWQGLLTALTVASLTGGLAGLALLVARHKRLGETLPFGPFLGIGLLTACFYPSLFAHLIFP